MFLPAGLEPWFEQAQTAADAVYEERVETQQREREEFEARRVGRTAAELLAETPEMPDWLIPGVLAPGWTIKIAEREKGGQGHARVLPALATGAWRRHSPAPAPWGRSF